MYVYIYLLIHMCMYKFLQGFYKKRLAFEKNNRSCFKYNYLAEVIRICLKIDLHLAMRIRLFSAHCA